MGEWLTLCQTYTAHQSAYYKCNSSTQIEYHDHHSPSGSDQTQEKKKDTCWSIGANCARDDRWDWKQRKVLPAHELYRVDSMGWLFGGGWEPAASGSPFYNTARTINSFPWPKFTFQGLADSFCVELRDSQHLKAGGIIIGATDTIAILIFLLKLSSGVQCVDYSTQET